MEDVGCVDFGDFVDCFDFVGSFDFVEWCSFVVVGLVRVGFVGFVGTGVGFVGQQMIGSANVWNCLSFGFGYRKRDFWRNGCKCHQVFSLIYLCQCWMLVPT